MTSQGKLTPLQQEKKKLSQLSDEQLREMIRPHIPRAIEILVELMESANNDSVRVSAVKTLLAKVMPDLKADEISGEIKGKWIVELKQYGNNRSNQVNGQSPE